MLKEWDNVRQRPDEGRRRWFTDEQFDLIVWYSDDGELLGFQLCYDKEDTERALTWYATGSYSHAKVDDGEGPFSANRTPILVADGDFDVKRIATEFSAAATRIDQSIAELVREKLLAYPSSGS